MKKYWPYLADIIEGVAIAIIATFMYIIFARTQTTGDSNLFWIVIFAMFDVYVIIAPFCDYYFDDPWQKQLALTAPYVFLLIDQYCLIDVGKISETCCNFWGNFSVGLAICVFNIAICIAEEVWDDEAAFGISLCSIIVVIRCIQLLVSPLF